MKGLFVKLELNNCGFLSLIKPNFVVERLIDSEKNKFRINLTQKELTHFLSINEISLNDSKQVTDGSFIFGHISYIN